MSKHQPPSPNVSPIRSARGRLAEQKLLDAANRVFLRRGFAGATIAAIVEEAGLSVGSFYHQFADKSALLSRAADRLLEDFWARIEPLELHREANGDLAQVFYRLTLTGRALVADHRGIYRAIAECAQNDLEAFGPLTTISPAVAERVQAVIGEYRDQLAVEPDDETVAHAVQLVTMSVLQTELSMAPHLPADNDAFALLIARAACGVLHYRTPTTAIENGDTR